MPIEQDTLVVTKNGQAVKSVPLSDEVTIGRHPSTTVQLEDHQMSRVHLRILRQQGRYFAVDNRSTNGTLVNGKRIAPDAPVALDDSSVVRCACFELRLELRAAELSGATMPVAPADRTKLRAPAVTPITEAPPAPARPQEQTPYWTSGEGLLAVAGIVEETHDAKTFRFVSSDPAKPLLFSYKPGQFLTLSLPIDGKDVKRSYTISSSPSRPNVIEITVKRVPGGLVSNWLNDNLKLGDTLKVRGPAGKFSCVNHPCLKMLGIAGGSGVTPVMSMARWVCDTAADVDFSMVYSARTPRDIIFRRELEYLATRHPGFRVLVTVSGGAGGLEPWLSLSGRIDERMLRLAAPDLEERHIFMCGPQPFMDTVKDVLKSVGFPMDQLHTESFGAGRVAAGTPVAPAKAAAPASPAPAAAAVRSAPRAQSAAQSAAPAPAPVAPAPAAPAAPPRSAPAASGFQIVFAKSGKTVQTDGELPLLDLAEQNGVDIEYSCRSGSCGTCRTKCKPGGKVDMGSDHTLDPDEEREGWVLACCAKPRSNLTVEA